MSHTPCLLLIDAMSLAYRAFHAIPPLSSKDGTPTNALMGFVKSQRQMVDRFAPSHIAVVFDGGLPATRLNLLPEYKAQRAEMPEELAKQLPLLDAYLDASSIPRIRVAGQEADDVLATLAKKASERGLSAVIATNDKDLFQLVDPAIHLVAPVKDAPALDEVAIEEKTGVPPRLIPAWLALTGDTVDNIPGVPGIGPKTASKLLQQFGSLEDMWSHLNEVKSDKLRESLLAHRDIVARNLAMTTLDTAVTPMPELSDLVVRPPRIAELRALLVPLGMSSLVPEAVAPTQMELL